jgi:hypothetical protein
MKKLIYFLFAITLIAGALTFESCSKDDTLPKIDGYNNSNEVSSTNLVAHWTFDDTKNEVISSTAPSNTYGTTEFTTGQIGKALKLTGGALVFPTITNINSANALNNFTVSLWANVTNNKDTDNHFNVLFALIPSGVSDIWGDINIGIESGAHISTSDTVMLKPLLNTHPVGGGNSLQDNISNGNGSNDAPYFLGNAKWIHYVATWNAATHQFKIYGNGVSVGSYNDRGTTGALIMATPVQAVFGSVGYNDIGFASAPDRGIPMAKGSVDDVRIFNTVLDDVEISALFNLGTAGR